MNLRDLLKRQAPPPRAAVADAVDRFVPSEAEAAVLKAELDRALLDYEQRLAELAQQQLETATRDVQDARDKELRRLQADRLPPLARHVGYLLDLVVATVWAACTIYLLLRALKLVDVGGADLTGVLALYSTVTATFMTCLTYHRGSSASSQAKDAALRASLTASNTSDRG